MRKGNDFKREPVGQRLYLFFAGHGFTSSNSEEAALFTAKAQDRDYAHIATRRYFSRITIAKYFREVVLIFDACQKVVVTTTIADPSWSPPRLQGKQTMSAQFIASQADQASFEAPKDDSARGYFSRAFMEALRTAPANNEGYVTTTQVAAKLARLWQEGKYAEKTGVSELPDHPAHDFPLYYKGQPPQRRADDGPSPSGSGPPRLPVGPGPGIHVPLQGDFEGPTPMGDRLPTAAVTAVAADIGAAIQLFDEQGREVATGVGRTEAALPAGGYLAMVYVGDAVEKHPFVVERTAPASALSFGPLKFSTPVPLAGTLTAKERQAHRLGGLRKEAAELAAKWEPAVLAGSILLFARDSTHEPGADWLMPVLGRKSLRIRRVFGDANEAAEMDGSAVIEPDIGVSWIALQSVPPGTYLVGVRRPGLADSYWQEIVVTVANGWRTEVLLDAVDVAAERRFDAEAAAVQFVKANQAAPSAEWARRSETSRQMLSRGTRAIDARLTEDPEQLAEDAPMTALLTAYAVARQDQPDLELLQRLCTALRKGWGLWSADVKILDLWRSWKENEDQPARPMVLGPNEVPMVDQAWELVRQCGTVKLSTRSQLQVAVWRAAARQWTQLLVPVTPVFQAPPAGEPVLIRSHRSAHPSATSSARARALVATIAPSAAVSPLLQAARRAVLDCDEEMNSQPVSDVIGAVARLSAVEPAVVLGVLNAPLQRSAEARAAAAEMQAIEKRIKAARERIEAARQRMEASARAQEAPSPQTAEELLNPQEVEQEQHARDY